MRMQASVTAVVNMRGMMTGMAFMKCTSRPWKAFGPYCEHGCAHIEVSPKTIDPGIWASVSLCTT